MKCVMSARIVMVLFLLSTNAHAVDADPWFARDKAAHFAVSTTLTGGGYALGAALFDGRFPALLAGFGVGAVVGIGKESLDLVGLGDPSWRDLAWDGLGIVSGLVLALGADLLLRGVHPHGGPAFTF